MSSSFTTARWAADLAASVGVNTHVDFTWTSYGSMPRVTAALAYLGVKNVRDAINGPDDAAKFQALNRALGITFDFFIAPGSRTPAWQWGQIEANAAITRLVEGPNESDIWPRTYGGLSGLAATAAIQHDLYAFAHASAALSGVGVVQSSLARAASFDLYGNQAAAADYANTHTYFGTANPPGSTFETLIDLAQQATPGAPTITTEAGYYTVPGDKNGVSETVQAKYDLTLLMDQFQAGVTKTYLYELLDEQANSTIANNNFGLFHADGTPKLAATAVRNLLAALSDSSPNSGTTAASRPGKLAYSLGNVPGTVNSMLLQKADGSYVLAIWNDARLSGPSAQQDLAVASVPVTLTLAAARARVDVVDPLLGTAAVQSFRNAGQLVIAVPDHPILVELSAATSPVRTAASMGVAASTAWTGPAIPVIPRQAVAVSSDTAVTGLAVADDYAPGHPGQMSATLSVGKGALTATATDAALSGAGTGTLTIRGTYDQVNAALAGVHYLSGAAAGGDTLRLTAYDQLGLSATRLVGLSILPATDVQSAQAQAQAAAADGSGDAFATTDLATGAAGGAAGADYAGPVDYLERQLIWAGGDGVAIQASVPNVFLHGGSGDDALAVKGGSNVLDGGSGSNFLVGGDGRDGGVDTFFVDGRGGGTTWSTIVNFHPGDMATIFDPRAGSGTLTWTAAEGAAGYEGATVHAAFPGGAGGVESMTFAGIGLDTVQQRFAVSSGVVDGNPYLSITYT